MLRFVEGKNLLKIVGSNYKRFASATKPIGNSYKRSLYGR